MPNLEGLDPNVRAAAEALVKEARRQGIPATITSAYRSREEQERLWRLRQAGKWPYPVARPGTSRHEHGLAVDISVPAQHRPDFNQLAAQFGFRWFGPRDRVHYDYVGKHSGQAGHVHRVAGYRETLVSTPLIDRALGLSAGSKPERPERQERQERPERQAPKAVQPTVSTPLIDRALGRVPKAEAPKAEAPKVTVPKATVPKAPKAQASATPLIDRALAARPAEPPKPPAAPPVGKAAFYEKPQAAITAALNTLAKGQGIKQAFREAVRTWKAGELPDFKGIRETFKLDEKLEKGQIHPDWYAAWITVEQLLPIAYDPVSYVAGPATRLVGLGAKAVAGTKAVQAVTRPAKEAVGRGLQAVAKKGGTVAEVLGGLAPTKAVAEKSEQIVARIINPVLRHKEDLQHTVRIANDILLAERRRNPALEAKIQRYKPKSNLAYKTASGLVLHRIAGDADKWYDDVASRLGLTNEGKQAISALADRLERQVMAAAASEKPRSLKQFAREYLAVGADNLPRGLEVERNIRRRRLIARLSKEAADEPAYGYSRLPDKEEYGTLRGKYLPRDVVVKTREIIEEQPPTVLEKATTVTKAAVLWQPWTPVRNVIQNAAGVGTLLAKYQVPLLGAVARHAPSAAREIWKYLVHRRLSPAMREFSNHDPAFLKSLEKATLATGSAGRFVKVGGRIIHLDPKAAAGKLGKLTAPFSTDHVFLRANSAIDYLSKLTAFKALRAKGLSSEDAVRAVNRHVVSYGGLPPRVGELVSFLDKNGILMFAHVPVHLARMALDTAVRRPDLLARPGQVQSRMLDAFGKREEYEKLPEKEKSPFVVPHPTEAARGRTEFLKYTALHPLGDPYDRAKGALRAQVTLESLKEAAKGTIAGPIIQAVYGRPGRREEGASPGVQRRELLEDLVRLYLPSLHAITTDYPRAKAGMPGGEFPYTVPKGLAEYLLQKAGMPRAERLSLAEEQALAAPYLRARLHQAQQAFAEALEKARRAPRKDYVELVRRLTKDDVMHTLIRAKKYAFSFTLRPDIVDAKGRLTASAKRDIQDHAHWLVALQNRWRELTHE